MDAAACERVWLGVVGCGRVWAGVVHWPVCDATRAGLHGKITLSIQILLRSEGELIEAELPERHL